MAKTFNRRPVTVGTPSSSDIKDYFFTHNEWKGLSDGKNFLTVDQDTFSECNNVYINSEGVLRSRPSVKIKTITDGITTLSDIAYVWRFADVTVYKVKLSASYQLVFDNPILEGFISVPCEENIKLVLAEGKIFVFGNQSINYFDINETDTKSCYRSAVDFIYIPITKKVMGSLEEDLESPNELTTSYIKRYQVEDINDANFSLFIGKTVTVTLNGETYEVQFENYSQVTFVEKLTDLTADTFYNNEFPMVSVSDNNTILMSKIIDGEYYMYYTSTGLVFNPLPVIYNVIGIPQISVDGHCAVCLTEEDIYAYSLIGDTYKTWTPLLKTFDKTFYDSLPQKKFDNACNIKMLNSDTFAATAKVRLGLARLQSLICITSHYGELNKHYIQSIETTQEEFKTFDLNNYGTLPIVTNFSNGYITHHSDNNLDSTINLRYSNFKITQNYTDIRQNTYELEITVSLTRVIDGHEDVIITKTYSRAFGMPVEGEYGDKYSVRLDNLLIIEIEPYYDSGEVCLIAPSTQVDFLRPYVGNNGDYDNWYTTYNNVSNIDIMSNKEDLKVAIHTNDIFVINSKNDIEAKFVISTKDTPLYQGLYLTEAGLYFNHWSIDNSNKHVFKSSFYEFSKSLISNTETLYEVEDSSKIKTTYSGMFLATGNRVYFSTTGRYKESNALYLLFDAQPLFANNYSLYLNTSFALYSNVFYKDLMIDVYYEGEIKYMSPDFVSELSNFYFAKDKALYISSYPSDGNFKWYFPAINTEQFDYNISNIHPISANEMAVFLPDSVYYIQTSEHGYLYYKSKIEVGCKKGADVITSFDGKYIIFPSTRGLVALSYEQLVASTEQILIFLSDSIIDTFKKFNSSRIKLFKYEHWIICYKDGSSDALVFDIRNNSWWPMTIPYLVDKIVHCDDGMELLISGNIYILDTSNEEYHDYDGLSENQIQWKIKSQKLHFNATNYYKHISNITLISVLDAPSNEPFDLNLTVTNYRKRSNTSDVENFTFDVDSIRIYVRKLNYSKVNEFQYLLESDDENELKIPLSLSSITVKYKISRKVR